MLRGRHIRPGHQLRRMRISILFVLLMATLIAFSGDIGQASAKGPPTFIFHNGQVVTMEPDQPRAHALAVRGEEIMAVGSNKEILSLQTAQTEIIDLKGKALLPGFVDTHTHVFQRAHFNDEITFEQEQQFALRTGTTTVAELSVFPALQEQLQGLERADDLRLRTNLYLRYNGHCDENRGHWYRDQTPVRDPHRMLRTPGVKIFADGAGGCREDPAVSFAYPEWFARNHDDGDNPKGDLYFSEEALSDVVSEAQDLGYQVAIHSVGDRAVETVLNSYETVLDGGPNTHRHRIEHSYLLRPDMRPRFGELGVLPTVLDSQACWIANHGKRAPGGDIIHPYGEIVHPWANPIRSLINANPGLPVAWHSDRPHAGLGPMPELYSLVTGNEVGMDGERVCEVEWLKPKAITVEEGLRLMTINGAYSLFMEDHIGSLKQGKFADLVVLSQNPLAVDVEQIKDINVLMTMVGGEIEHQLEDSDGDGVPDDEDLCPDYPGRPEADGC